MNWLFERCSIQVNTPPGTQGVAEVAVEVARIQGFQCIFVQFLHIAVRLAGLAAFVMIIIGGFQYFISTGDPKATVSAQKTLTFAVLGLAITVGAWFLLRFVEEFTGIRVTQFTFPAWPVL